MVKGQGARLRTLLAISKMDISGVRAIPSKGLGDVFLLHLHMVEVTKQPEAGCANGLDDFNPLALEIHVVGLLFGERLDEEAYAGALHIRSELRQSTNKETILDFTRRHDGVEMLEAVAS